MSYNQYLSHYACPNDRILAMLSKLHKGWSIKAQNPRNPHLRTDETLKIIEVIRKAEIFDSIERQRIENLLKRAENLRTTPTNNQTMCAICHKSFRWFLHIRHKRQCAICLAFVCRNCISRDK